MTVSSAARIGDVAIVTDYVANGSFETLRNNVTYKDTPDHAVLVRLVDHNAGWKGNFVYVDRASYEFLRKSRLVARDIVIANVGANAGTVFRVPDLGLPMTLGPNAILCRANDENALNNDFLFYWLVSPAGQQSIRSVLTGSAQPKFNKTDFRSLRVTLPSISTQRAIASLLCALDDKIDLNRRMNETLEAMARAIFKDWFVAFGPTRAKMEGRAPYLAPELWALFPDRMDGEGKPAGWLTTRWGQIATLEYGKGLSGYGGEAGPYPVFGTNGQIGYNSKPLCEHPGIIIGRKGAYRGVHYCERPFFVIDTAFYVEPRNHPIELRWAYYELLRQDINDMDSGSAIPSTSREEVYGLAVVFPPFEVQRSFVKVLRPIWVRQEHNRDEARTLAALRDVLLPKLMSGEIGVNEAEKTVAEVA